MLGDEAQEEDEVAMEIPGSIPQHESPPIPSVHAALEGDERATLQLIEPPTSHSASAGVTGIEHSVRTPSAGGGTNITGPRGAVRIDIDEKRPGNVVKVRCVTGHFSMQGVRAEMEDKTTLLPHPLLNREGNLTDDTYRSFFAVYDGHGGDVSAEYCHQHAHQNLVREAAFHVDPVAALYNAVIKTDDDFCKACRRIKLQSSSGTTAIIAYVENDLLVVANVGDSRAVLCRNGKAVPVSIDHKPCRPDERQRIEARGGVIATTEEEALGRRRKRSSGCLRRLFAPKRPLRVFPGGLSVSRTIGDVGERERGLIVCEPEMYQTRLRAGDSFLCLACDGVWDVLSNQQVVDIIKRSTHDADAASRAVAKEAFRKGSTDNISVIVVFFHILSEEEAIRDAPQLHETPPVDLRSSVSPD